MHLKVYCVCHQTTCFKNGITSTLLYLKKNGTNFFVKITKQSEIHLTFKTRFLTFELGKSFENMIHFTQKKNKLRA